MFLVPFPNILYRRRARKAEVRRGLHTLPHPINHRINRIRIYQLFCVFFYRRLRLGVKLTTYTHTDNTSQAYGATNTDTTN